MTNIRKYVFNNGPLVLSTDTYHDDRGSFHKFFNQANFIYETKKNFEIKQVNLSTNKLSGTFRGLHYQKHPFADGKIIKCIKGKICDFVIDLRRDSPTFLKHICFELFESDNNLLYIPEGFAHGFQTLMPDTEIIYFHNNEYHKENDSVLNIADPILDIKLPQPISIISDRDLNAPYISFSKFEGHI